MKEKINIGIFIDTFFPMIDGVAMVVDNYAKRLQNKANVTVFAPKYSKYYDDSKYNYKIVRCKSIKMPFIDYSLPLPALDRKFKKELRNSKLDIIHIHSPFTIGNAAIKYGKRNGIPIIGTMHSQYKQDFRRQTKSKLLTNILTKKVVKTFEKCDECWTVNNEVARIFNEDYGYKEIPKTIYNATEMKLLPNKNEADKIVNEKYNIDEKEKVLLFVGRINKLKNIFFIIDSLKLLYEKGYNYKMLFVGTGQDEESLKNYIRENKLNNNIIMCGKITDRNLLASIYSRADLFLFPSLYDASSVVQIEAASQKTPGLFLQGAATSATIENNINGFIEENDSEKYAERIIKIFNDKELYEKVCDNAYKQIYKNWDTITDEVYQLYIDLIESGKE